MAEFSDHVDVLRRIEHFNTLDDGVVATFVKNLGFTVDLGSVLVVEFALINLLNCYWLLSDFVVRLQHSANLPDMNRTLLKFVLIELVGKPLLF